jgi:hypothetical protein
LSSLIVASDEQYESIPDDNIALLARKFWVMHKFWKERRRNSWGCFECGNTTHFIADYPKRKKYDYSNKNDYKKKNHFRDKKKRNIKKIMSEHVQPCATSTSHAKTHQVQKRMRRSTIRRSKTTSPVCASWPREDLRGTTLTPTLM